MSPKMNPFSGPLIPGLGRGVPNGGIVPKAPYGGQPNNPITSIPIPGKGIGIAPNSINK